MVRARHNPRKGSLMHRPRKRAYKETPSFNSFPEMKGPAKPMNFYGYKVGMIHLIAQSQHAGGKMDKQDMQIPTTVIECPPVHVFGVRAYTHDAYGLHVAAEMSVDKLEKSAQKKLTHFKKKSAHKKNHAQPRSNTTPFTFEKMEEMKSTLNQIRLLVHTHPEKTSFGKKKAEVAEVALSGTIDEQIAFAKQKFGQTIAVSEVFKDNQDVDVKAVTRGFGMGGVIARFGIKTFRPKAKYIRTVGSISPLNPRTVQFSVARPGQLGYHNRTEFNKRILKITNETAKLNPKAGFEHYGPVQNEFILLAGSIPGPVKRLVGLRECIRPDATNHYKIGAVKYVSTTGGAW
ncbi:MAG: 50S ribosomal protein L3 [Candidatus Diapherotrites archaeon]|uniref:50S ribosomal protein L3 n=1 Tax=Candidatus Iainarchaeum sp. TaxID=3101447 RepID=A0A8T4CA50_9ARCH|nr:50S ribosomal protein L3 [Candidatus Diapherotrites archaeon]